MEPLRGLIYGIERFAMHDGPGIRTLVFMKGCPLKCLWCSSPQTQKAHPEIAHDRSACLQCGKCIEACPKGALSFDEDGVLRIDRALCDRCGQCLDVCPGKALQLLGKRLSVDELYKEVAKDSAFFRRSQGGVTVGGGEPTFQADFVARFMKRCKSGGMHTAMETCGYCPWEGLEKIIEHTNMVFMDIKHMDDGEHRRLTGVSNETILENARNVAQKRPLVLRLPVVPGLNDAEENIRATAEFAAGLGNNFLRLELLPYHELGLDNYERLGLTYSLADVESPSNERMELLRGVAAKSGIEVRVPGQSV